MSSQTNKIDFTGQHFFIGLDVHKKNWAVTVRQRDLDLCTFSMNPNPEELSHYLRNRYTGGIYHSVYEAGFCGFWIHRRLLELQIENIVVHAADVPTTRKEKNQKRDPIDSRKLARELANGSLHGIWVPDTFHEELRSLSRLREKMTRHQTRLKNRIKGHLHFNGIPIPDRAELHPWSGDFIRWLQSLTFHHEPAREYLLTTLSELIDLKRRIAGTLRSLRRYSQKAEIKQVVHDLLMSIPGIGFVIAITFYTEIVDPKRFARLDELASFVGLIPCVVSSSDKEINLGLSQRHNKFLRYLLIEAAWVAVRKDPVMTMAFNLLCKRMSRQEAIVRIAKKLLNRMRCVWGNQEPYVKGVC